MSVKYRWILDKYDMPVLELQHEGKWTVLEMSQSIKDAMQEQPDRDFVAMCVFPDNKYFPPDAIVCMPGLVRSTDFKRFKGLVNVRHPLNSYLDMRSGTISRLMDILGFPMVFSPDHPTAEQEVSQLAVKKKPEKAKSNHNGKNHAQAQNAQ